VQHHLHLIAAQAVLNVDQPAFKPVVAGNCHQLVCNCLRRCSRGKQPVAALLALAKFSYEGAENLQCGYPRNSGNVSILQPALKPLRATAA
jgi:hypothetical protein